MQRWRPGADGGRQDGNPLRRGREKDRSCRRRNRAGGYRSADRRMRKTQAGRLAGESSPVPKTQVRRSGDPAIRRSGDPAIRRSGDPAIRRSGDPAIRRSGDPAIRRSGDPAIRRSGDPAIRRSGDPAIRRSGDPAIRRSGDPAIRRSGDPAIRRSGDPAIRRSGDPAIRRSGDPAIRRSGDPAIRRSGDPAIILRGAPLDLVNPCAKQFFARPAVAASAAPSARIACRPSLKMVIAISPNLSPGLPVRTARKSAERRLFRLAYRMPNRAGKQCNARSRLRDTTRGAACSKVSAHLHPNDDGDALAGIGRHRAAGLSPDTVHDEGGRSAVTSNDGASRMTVCPDAGHAASSSRHHDRPRVATQDPLNIAQHAQRRRTAWTCP